MIYENIGSVKVYPDNTTESKERGYLREHTLQVILNGKTVYSIVCTGSHLEEMAVGRLYTDRRIDPCSIETECTGEVVYVTAKECTRSLAKLPRTDIGSDEVFRLAKVFAHHSGLHEVTNTVHKAILSHSGNDIIFEDISRHNTVDKAVGYAILNDIPLSECVLFTSGRIPVDMADKVISAGIPVLVSKSLPTADAVRYAAEYGLKLICRAWEDSYECGFEK